MAVRLNPSALKRLLKKVGFSTVIAYDTPLGCTYRFQVHLVAATESLPDLVKTLNQGHAIPDLHFYPWQGDRLDGFSLRSGWRSFVSRVALRIAYGVCERLGGSAARKTRRVNIARHVGRYCDDRLARLLLCQTHELLNLIARTRLSFTFMSFLPR